MFVPSLIVMVACSEDLRLRIKANGSPLVEPHMGSLSYS